MLLFVLDWRDHSDRGVQASVVEPVDVFGDGELEVLDRFPRAAVADELGFEERVECLGEGVVVTVAAGADRGDCAGFGETFGVADRSILTPRSLWWVSPVVSWPSCSRVQMPISRASRARSVRRLVESCQPTTRRENTSVTNAA